MALGTADSTRNSRGTPEIRLSGNYVFNNSDVPIFRRRLMLRKHGDIILS